MSDARIPAAAKFLPCRASFSAAYNTPTAGKYNFNVPVNQKVRLQQVYPNRLYCIAILNNVATIPEAAYQGNLVQVPAVQFGLETTNPILFGQAYPLPNYLINNEIFAYFQTDQSDDYLVASATGILSQNAALVGVSPIRIDIALNLFEITDKKFVRAWQQLSEEIPPVVPIPSQMDGRI